MALITYKGISQNSSIEKKLTDEEFSAIEKEYYAKPDISVVRDQLKKIGCGGTTMNKVSDYYLKEIMSKARGPLASWSIYDGIHYKPIMEYFAGKCEVNKKIFPDTNTLTQNIETAFRLCGVRYCVKLPNYPMKSVDMILQKYNVNNNYYDFSCGWASRMLSALHNNVNYYGTDPNYELIDALNNINAMYKDVNKSESVVDIRCAGSEEYVKEWEGKMGLAFSSPPYYDLEDYRIGNQSYKEGVTYDMWCDNYLKPTIDNIYKYLTDDGYFLINVKRVYSHKVYYDLERTVNDIAEAVGFKLVDIETLKNTKRCHGDAMTARGDKRVTLNDNSEKIFVFQKNKD